MYIFEKPDEDLVVRVETPPILEAPKITCVRHYCRLADEALEEWFDGCSFNLSSHSFEVPELHYRRRVRPLYRTPHKEDDLGLWHEFVDMSDRCFFKDRIIRGGFAGDPSSSLLKKGGIPSIGRRTPKELECPKKCFGVEVLFMSAEAPF